MSSTPAHTFVPSDEIRARFSSAMSEMYRDEVPQYGTLIELVADINQLIADIAGQSTAAGAQSERSATHALKLIATLAVVAILLIFSFKTSYQFFTTFDGSYLLVWSMFIGLLNKVAPARQAVYPNYLLKQAGS